MNTLFQGGSTAENSRPDSGLSPVWSHLTEAVISGLVAGIMTGLIESFLLTPERFIDFTKNKIMSFFFLLPLANISPFIFFNGIIMILALIAGVIWREFMARRYKLYYRSLNVLFVSLFLVVLYDLNQNNHVISLIDSISPLSYIFLSLVFLLVFLLADHIFILISQRSRFLRYMMCIVIPSVSVIVLISFLFQQTMDQVEVVERPVPGPVSIDKSENIILITIDTQRADFLGCYGHKSVKTPNINHLAQRGVLFNYCIAHAPITLPSHASILTSTYPVHHGVRENSRNAVSSSIYTLAEVLSENGYDTAAFLSSFVFGKQFGLDQGFEHYKINPSTQFLFYKRFLRGSVFSKIFLPYIPFSHYLLDCWVEAVTNNAILWIGVLREKPFFMWVHYFNPHDPYAPPFPYAIPYLKQMDGGEEGFFNVRTFDGEKRISSKELEWDKALYLGEITYTDYNIGLLLEALEKLNLMENTLIVLTADHGEAFGENNDITHGKTLYDTNIRIPLIFSSQNGILNGMVIDGLCESVDIMPTILDYVGVEGPDEMQGKSLLPHLVESKRLPGRIGFTETMGPHREEMRLYGIVMDNWKYTYTPWGTMESLFNLSEDPGETRNLVDVESEMAQRMKENLEGLVKTNTTEDKWERIELDVETLDHLRSLGYIQ